MTTKLRAASFQDGSVTTAKIAADAITNAKIADGAVDSDAIGSSAIVADKLSIGQIGGRRNIVINGGMQISQRGTSFSVSDNIYTLDRFVTEFSGLGAFTLTQSTDAPDGFGNSLKLDCTTADTSISAGEYFNIRQSLEGQDVQQLKKGTSSAEKITVSFYVKGNASATYLLELSDQDNTRYNGQTFAVTTSWNRIVLTYNGDTSGVLDNDNARSLDLNFWLHGGSTYTGGTFTSNTWHGTDNQRLASITSFFDSTDRTFFITGLQMEVGSQATPFEHRSFGEELALCQRYCFDVNPPTGASPNTPYIMSCASYNATLAISHVRFPCEMRTTPTTTLTGAAADFSIVEGNQTRVCTGFAANGLSSVGGGMTWTVNAGGMTTGQAGNVYIESNKRAFFDAEL